MIEDMPAPGATRRSALSALIAWSLCAAFTTAAMVLISLVPSEVAPDGWSAFEMAAFIPIALSFATVGALIEWRHPGHLIGRAMLFGAFVNTAQMVLAAYAVHSIWAGPHLPAGQIAAWLFNSIAIGLGVVLALLMFTFPDGRAKLRRARIGLLLSAVTLPLSALVIATRPGPLTVLPALENPFPVDLVGQYEPWIMSALLVLGLAVFVFGLSTVVERARLANETEKQQLKWFLAGSTVTVVVLMGAMPMVLGRQTVDVARFAVGIAMIAIPGSVGIAILRYRLYDINVVIHRTLVYGTVSTILIATYVAGVVLLQVLLRPFTSGSELAVAGATLIVVGLFQPIRGRVQALIDRRFYRSRYDAARTLDDFSVRLRNDVALESVQADLLDVVGATVRPTHASVWLRRVGH